MGIILNDQQEECISNAIKWYNNISSKQTFEISGPAGSGKTTIVKAIIENLNLRIEDVLFVAYVGKAALQLSRSGVNGRTIHSTFYNIEFRPVKDEEGNIIIVKYKNQKYQEIFCIQPNIIHKYTELYSFFSRSSSSGGKAA